MQSRIYSWSLLIGIINFLQTVYCFCNNFWCISKEAFYSEKLEHMLFISWKCVYRQMRKKISILLDAVRHIYKIQMALSAGVFLWNGCSHSMKHYISLSESHQTNACFLRYWQASRYFLWIFAITLLSKFSLFFAHF